MLSAQGGVLPAAAHRLGGSEREIAILPAVVWLFGFTLENPDKRAKTLQTKSQLTARCRSCIGQGNHVHELSLSETYP